jgi:hypothetical protein
MNDEVPMTKDSAALQAPFRILSFGFPSSFVIRHSDFVI